MTTREQAVETKVKQSGGGGEYRVGQKAWFESSSRRHKSREVTISKVGSRYVYYDSEIRGRTCRADTWDNWAGGIKSAYGLLYADPKSLFERKKAEKQWNYLKNITPNKRPDDMTEAKILSAIWCLGYPGLNLDDQGEVIK